MKLYTASATKLYTPRHPYRLPCSRKARAPREQEKNTQPKPAWRKGEGRAGRKQEGGKRQWEYTRPLNWGHKGPVHTRMPPGPLLLGTGVLGRDQDLGQPRLRDDGD